MTVNPIVTRGYAEPSGNFIVTRGYGGIVFIGIICQYIEAWLERDVGLEGTICR